MSHNNHAPGVHLIRRKGHYTKLSTTRVHKANNRIQTSSIELCGINNKSKPVTLSGTNAELTKLFQSFIERLNT